MAPPPPPPTSSRRRLKKEEMAALLSVLATVVVIVQRFLTDNQLLLPPSQTMALEASVKATTLALSKLQMMCSMAEAISLAGLQEDDDDEDEDENENENENDEDGDDNGNSYNNSNNDSHANGNVGAPSKEEGEGSTACWFESFLEGQQQEDDDDDDDNNEEWRTRFRMSKSVFLRLVEILRPELEKEEKPEEEEEGGESEGVVVVTPVPVEWKVGAALFRLAHGTDFKAMANRFGMGLSLCCRSFYKVCKALQEKLNHVFEFPSSLDGGLATIVDRFSQQGLPNCCAVIACTRFLIHPPLPPSTSSSAIFASSSASSSMDYYDHIDGSCSVVMQGVVDSVGRFLDISVGWGGSLSPSDILPRTRLFSRVEETRELLQGPPAELISGVLIPEYIIGDESYPLLPWLLTPYPRPTSTGTSTPPLSPAQLLFNSVHEYVRGAAAARAFGVLKAQWQLLACHQNADTMELLPFVVAAACILHNFLIDHGEPMPVISAEEVSSTQPHLLSPHHTHNINNTNNNNRNEYAQSIRDALASHINTVARLQMDFQ